MHAFDILGDPVRRRILETLAVVDQPSSGDIVKIINAEFGISQSAVSQHLKVLRNHGFVTVTSAGTKRLYELDAQPLSPLKKTQHLVGKFDWLGKGGHKRPFDLVLRCGSRSPHCRR